MSAIAAVLPFVARSLATRYARRRIYSRMAARKGARSSVGYRARLAKPSKKSAYRYNKSYHQYRGTKGKSKKRGKLYGLKTAETHGEPRTLAGSLSHGKSSPYVITARTANRYRKETKKLAQQYRVRRRRKRAWGY